MSTENTSSVHKMEKEGSEAMNHLVQGKRHMLVQDYPSAVYSLQESVQLFSKHYGETANECGEAYFCYGKALLEMAREETGVLGNAISKDSGEEEDEDGDDDDSENAEKSAEDKDGDEDEDKEEEDENEDDDENKGNNEEKENDDDDDDSEAVSENISNQSPDSTSQTDYPSEPGASGLQKTDSDEEVSSLQLAWEVLELAKVIFKRQAENNKEMQLKTADVLLKLGEVSIESENYKQAVDDLLECLEIQTEFLEPDSRQLAETHYQLGLAYSFDSQFEDAIQCFKNAVDVIEKRIANLKKLILEMGGSSVVRRDSIMFMSEDPVAKAEIEVTELEAILPDIQSKIEDMQDLIRNARKALFEASKQKLEEANFGNESGTSSSILLSYEALSSKPVSSLHTSNISHLVKRKKPDSIADVSSSSDSKKPKIDQSDNSLNGEMSVRGCNKKKAETNDLNEVSADTTQ